MKIAVILAKITFYAFLILGITILFLNHERVSTLLFAFGSFMFSWFLYYIMSKYKIANKEIFWLLVNLALWFNVLGEIGAYYTNLSIFGVTFYDKLIHFLVGILISAIIYVYYPPKSNLRKYMIFFIVLGMLGLWEIYEYVLMTFFSYPTMGVIENGKIIMSEIDDTMIDLIMGGIGSIGYLLFKRENLRSQIRKFKRR